MFELFSIELLFSFKKYFKTFSSSHSPTLLNQSVSGFSSKDFSKLKYSVPDYIKTNTDLSKIASDLLATLISNNDVIVIASVGQASTQSAQ